MQTLEQSSLKDLFIKEYSGITWRTIKKELYLYESGFFYILLLKGSQDLPYFKKFDF